MRYMLYYKIFIYPRFRDHNYKFIQCSDNIEAPSFDVIINKACQLVFFDISHAHHQQITRLTTVQNLKYDFSTVGLNRCQFFRDTAFEQSLLQSPGKLCTHRACIPCKNRNQSDPLPNGLCW